MNAYHACKPLQSGDIHKSTRLLYARQGLYAQRAHALRTDIKVSALIKGGLRSGNCAGINNMFIGIISSECNGE